MRWIDLSAHNAALWTTNGTGGKRQLVLEAIDSSRGIEGLDADLLKTLTDPPADAAEPSFESLFSGAAQPANPKQGLAYRLNATLIHGQGGQLTGIRVDHPEPDDPRPRMGLATWMNLAPRASIRDASTMLTGFPPVRDPEPEQLIRAQWLWAVPTDAISETNREAIGLPDNAPDTLYVINEADALRLSPDAAAVSDAGIAERLNPIPGLTPALYADGPVGEARFTPQTSEANASAETDDAEPSDAASDEALERREDYGEKIGGSRKDRARRAGVNATDWSNATTVTETRVTLRRLPKALKDDPPTQLAISYTGEALRAARKAARRPKRDQIWPKKALDALVADPNTSPLKALVAQQIWARLPKSTSEMVRSTASNPGRLTNWLLIAGRFETHIKAVRDRVEAIPNDQTIIDTAKEAINRSERFQMFKRAAAEVEENLVADKRIKNDRETIRRFMDEAQDYAAKAEDLQADYWRIGEGKDRINVVWWSQVRSGSLSEATEVIGLSEDDRLSADSDQGRALTDEDASIEVVNEAITREIEGYGETLNSESLDRLLSIAGRVGNGKRAPNPHDFATLVLQSVGQIDNATIDAVRHQADHDYRRRFIETAKDYSERQKAFRYRSFAIQSAEIAAITDHITSLEALVEAGETQAFRERLDGTGPAEKADDTHDEARGETAASLESVIPKVATTKNPRFPSRYQHLDREGPTRVEGTVTEAMVAETFGLRAIEYGEWVQQTKNTNERQALLDMAYESFSDMAEALEIPKRAIGFDGKLALALGARGRGGRVAAHYEPDRVVINLTKTMGAGTLAHEWAHALDHEIQRQQARGTNATYESQAALREGFRTSRTPAAAQGLLHYDPEADTGDNAAGVAMRALFKAMVINDQSDTGNRLDCDDLVRGEAVRAVMTQRLLKPKVIAEAIERGTFSDTPEARKREIAANWPKRVEPFMNWLGEAAGDKDHNGVMMAGCCHSGTRTYKPAVVVEKANACLEQAGQPRLDNDEQFVFECWFRFKDMRYAMDRAAQHHRDLAVAGGVSPKRLTDFFQSATRLEIVTRSKKDEAYWTSPEELFARGFSTVVDERMREKGIKNDFATIHSRPNVFTAEKGFAVSPNPEGDEVATINRAAEPLIKIVRDFAPEADLDDDDNDAPKAASRPTPQPAGGPALG